jgi:putative addiction module killer protein
MIDVRVTEIFDRWFGRLKDRTTRIRIQVCIDRVRFGHFGSHRELRGGIGELKLDFGPGYRLYYTRRSAVSIVLLCAGDKSTQARDIERATELAELLED